MGVRVSALPTDDRHSAKRVQPLSVTAEEQAKLRWASSACEIMPPAYPLWTVENPGFPCHLSLAMTDTMWFLGFCHSSNLV